ncbi:hypothetical protein [Paenibacillus polymyxa]|uniref:hypothetical protein n=1 Tax=Paenibacillus polymyxa TaxID=1406 RepID=UPI002AB5100F|nr:hypothetical protein [Paenibacillus polymyxa]MDY8022734.1 hypothetical protein [Paenibacillus polymyxa]
MRIDKYLLIIPKGKLDLPELNVIRILHQFHIHAEPFVGPKQRCNFHFGSHTVEQMLGLPQRYSLF